MRVLKWLAAILLVAAATIAALIWALLPPDLAAAPVRDRLISDVTVINPGQRRATRQTIVVRDGKIAEVRD